VGLGAETGMEPWRDGLESTGRMKFGLWKEDVEVSFPFATANALVIVIHVFHHGNERWQQLRHFLHRWSVKGRV
jgi:hypothetical protein